jgi:hypothetical protein
MRSSTLMAGLVAITLLAAPPVAAGDPFQAEVAAPQTGPKDYSKNSVTGEHADVKDGAALSPRVQDLRRLAAGNGDIRTSSLAGTTSATRGGHPAQQRASVPPAGRPAGGGDDPWTAIAVGFAGGCLVAGGAAAIAGRTRRARIAA